MGRAEAWVAATALAAGALGFTFGRADGGGDPDGGAERLARLEAENADLRRDLGRHGGGPPLAVAAPSPRESESARAPGAASPPRATLAARPASPSSSRPADGAAVVDSLVLGLRAAVAAGDEEAIRAYRLALAARGDDAAAALLAIASDPRESEALRAVAFGALVRTTAPGRLEAAVAALEAGVAGDLRTTALSLAVDAAGAAAGDVPAVRDAMAARRPLAERDMAIAVVLSRSQEAALDAIGDLLRDRDPAARAVALRWLQRVSIPEAAPLVREALRSGDLSPDDRRLLGSALSRTKGPSWSAAQATGEPDTTSHGDHASAWAHKKPDMGLVTLTLEYEREVRPEAVRVHETFNSGAVARIEGVRPGGAVEILWEGVATRTADARWFEPPLAPGSPVRVVRLVLDTDRVPGWNEVDAVELVGDGVRQWARAASATSSYSDP